MSVELKDGWLNLLWVVIIGSGTAAAGWLARKVNRAVDASKQSDEVKDLRKDTVDNSAAIRALQNSHSQITGDIGIFKAQMTGEVSNLKEQGQRTERKVDRIEEKLDRALERRN